MKGSKMKAFYEELIEYDLNPFMMFTSDGKLSYYNKEAEFLLSYVSNKELYELAMANAPISFGFKRTFTSLHFERNIFYAILVGYLDEDKIGIKLYKEVCDSIQIERKEKMTEVNIFTLINLSRTTVLSQTDIVITELYDPSLPDMKLDVEKFLKLLNQILKSYENAKELNIKVFLKIGETIVVKGKKYPICAIKFQSYSSSIQNETTLYTNAKDAGISLFIKPDFIMIEFPML
jgi:hypothetical protein